MSAVMEQSQRWTKADLAQLTRLWEVDGLTASEIAAVMGRTRNAIIGRVRRMNLSRRAPGFRAADRERRSTVNPTYRAKPKPVRDTRDWFSRMMGDPLPGRSALDRKRNTLLPVCNLVGFVATQNQVPHIKDRHSNSEAVG